MMSRVGLELTNFINPDLNWKTVPKSLRTGSRRSRKQVTKLADSSGKMVEDAETTVSESEKLGVAVLGRRFSDKAEHVPLKKRKSMFRHPSPPPQSDSGQLDDIQKSRSQVCTKSSPRKQLKTSADSTIKFAHTTDFSGIEILADVACSSSIGDDAVIVEGSVAEEPKREVIDSSGTANCSQKDTMHEERNDDGILKRLHWDLNLSMDAWEQPPEIDYQENSAEGIMPQISESRESREEDTEHKIVHTGNSPVGRLVSSNVSENINTKILIPKVCKTRREIKTLEFSPGIDKNHDKPLEFSEDVTNLQMAEYSQISIVVEQKPEVDDKQNDEHGASTLKSGNDEVMNRDVAWETDSSILNEVAEKSCVSPTAKSEGVPASGASIREVVVVHNADKAGSPHRIESSTVEAPMHDDGCNKNRSSSSSSSEKVSVDEHACQDDYDSQFEDGELRETDLRCWDTVDNEAEYVDYGTDDNGETFDTDDYSAAVTGKAEMGSDCGEEGTCASEADMEKNVNAISDHLIGNGRSGSSEMYANPTKGSKSSRKELQPSLDVLDRNDTVPLRRGRFDHFYDSYSRDRPGGHSFYPSGGFRGSKRGHSPTHYGPYNSGRSRPRISDAVPGLDNRVHGPFMNPSSNGMYRPYVRRRSPSEREDLYNPVRDVRDISPERRRFRRYPQGINRGLRLPEDEYFNNRLPQRRAPPHYHPQPFRKSRSKSRSRSRSRSPTGRSRSPAGWLLPRNRYNRSRSPEFRSKGRVERTVRAPFHRPGFEPGYEAGPRWFDDRNGGRRLSPPVRMARLSQRFDSARPVRRMMNNPSDDGFRPPANAMHRYTRKYEGGEDDRRKNGGERYKVIHRVRRFDSDGPVRRFRYDAEDSFRRPQDGLPRRGSEEKDQLSRSNQDQHPRLNQDQQPRLNQDHQPRLNQEKPRWDQDHHPVSNQDQNLRLNQEQPRWDQDHQPRSKQDHQLRLNQEKPRWDLDHHPISNQDQNLRWDQEQPRLNQNQQPRFNQDSKANNASPESIPLLAGQAA